jgi:hypothetical protein
VLASFKLALPVLDCSDDHSLYARGVNGIEHITEPLLVNVHPVRLIWQVLEDVGVLSGILEEVLHCEPIYLRNH